MLIIKISSIIWGLDKVFYGMFNLFKCLFLFIYLTLSYSIDKKFNDIF